LEVIDLVADDGRQRTPHTSPGGSTDILDNTPSTPRILGNDSLGTPTVSIPQPPTDDTTGSDTVEKTTANKIINGHEHAEITGHDTIFDEAQTKRLKELRTCARCKGTSNMLRLCDLCEGMFCLACVKPDTSGVLFCLQCATDQSFTPPMTNTQPTHTNHKRWGDYDSESEESGSSTLIDDTDSDFTTTRSTLKKDITTQKDTNTISLRPGGSTRITNKISPVLTRAAGRRKNELMK